MTAAKTDAIAPIVKTVEVGRGPEDAFALFADLQRWWPREKHSLSAMIEKKPAAQVTLEPKVGGRVFETTPGGEELPWGEVTAFEPGRRLAFTWRVGKPVEQSTFVEIRFDSLKSGRTRVELTHTGWDAIADDPQAARDDYDGGWVGVMDRFAKTAG